MIYYVDSNDILKLNPPFFAVYLLDQLHGEGPKQRRHVGTWCPLLPLLCVFSVPSFIETHCNCSLMVGFSFFSLHVTIYAMAIGL